MKRDKEQENKNKGNKGDRRTSIEKERKTRKIREGKNKKIKERRERERERDIRHTRSDFHLMSNGSLLSDHLCGRIICLHQIGQLFCVSLQFYLLLLIMKHTIRRNKKE